jgi:hypothetical protein
MGAQHQQVSHSHQLDSSAWWVWGLPWNPTNARTDALDHCLFRCRCECRWLQSHSTNDHEHEHEHEHDDRAESHAKGRHEGDYDDDDWHDHNSNCSADERWWDDRKSFGADDW